MKTSRLLLIAPFVLAVLATGCKPDWPKCENDDHCKREVEGTTYDYVCVQGTCVECAADTDCKEGFICRANACVPKPECTTNMDCAAQNKICQNEKCVFECTTNEECAAGMKCENNHCVPDVECTVDADCAEGEECNPQGECVTKVVECTFEVVYFDFNSSSLTSDARTTVEQNAECLRQKNERVTLAGHADERGTEEYNLALGERRANAVKQYLQNLGIQSSLLKVTSYGEERPADTGSSEDAWARNRRVEFEAP